MMSEIAYIVLPMPPTTNNLFAGNGKRRYRTAKYKSWAKEAGLMLMLQQPPQYRGQVCVHLFVGEPKNERDMDLANREKAAIDLLVEHQIIQGDGRKYVRRIIMDWAAIEGIEIKIS